MKKKFKESSWIIKWVIVSILFLIVVHIAFQLDGPKWLEAKWDAGELLTYVSTVSLGLLAFWQNDKLNKTNKEILLQQLRQKIGYFNLNKNKDSFPASSFTSNIYLQVGQIIHSNPDIKDEKIMIVWLVNVGEDVISSFKIISAKVNNQNKVIQYCSGLIYKQEKIAFEFEDIEYKDSENISIELVLELSNLSGITYKQSIEIKAYPVGDKTYLVNSFNTKLEF